MGRKTTMGYYCMRPRKAFPGTAIIAGLAGAVFSFTATAAEDYELSQFIGQDGSAILEELGEPTLKTPTELWYSNEPYLSGGRLSPPNPAVRIGQHGITVSGAGGTYEPLQFDREACDITVTIGEDHRISAVNQAGPGCFNFIHSLRTRQRGTPQP